MTQVRIMKATPYDKKKVKTCPLRTQVTINKRTTIKTEKSRETPTNDKVARFRTHS